jgi:hypothetical protein
MNKKNLWIDLALFAAFLVAASPRFTGVTIHEWLGLAFAGGLILHLLMHWKWITQVGARFFKKVWHTSRLQFVLDVLLFVAFTAIIGSGVMISRSVSSTLGLSLGNVSQTWEILHRLATDAVILLTGIHLALNWSWIVVTLKRVIISPLAAFLSRRQSPQAGPLPVRSTEK